MSKYKLKPLYPKSLNTYPLESRKSKVKTEDFARVWQPGHSMNDFVSSLPNILAGRDFKEFVNLMHLAKIKQKAIIFSMGAHIIKCGLNPIVIDMMRNGWITALGLNGAGIIHDFEIAYAGKTSEDVKNNIKDGDFGMAEETGEILNDTINSSLDHGVGVGEAIGKMISESGYSFKHLSLLAAAYKLNIPVTVHVALGTDIVHFHPKIKGDAWGEMTLRDFFLFCSLIRELQDGGVFINAGSAVILPEVFLKAVSYVRNQGFTLQDFTTAVFDFIDQYRARVNITGRPVGNKGRGFYFIGSHELMIPLLAAALK